MSKQFEEVWHNNYQLSKNDNRYSKLHNDNHGGECNKVVTQRGIPMRLLILVEHGLESLD